jgi:TPR repeat protein
LYFGIIACFTFYFTFDSFCFQSRVVYAAAFAGDMKSQLKLGAKHELDRPSANLRLALAWFLRAATHPVVAKLAPTSEFAETAEISMASAALGAIPASSVFQSLVVSSDETPAPNRAWWHSSSGSRSVVLPQIGSEDPLSSYVPVSVDTQPAPFLVAVSPPETLPLPQPAARFETSVRISETPLPTSSILPRLSFIRKWSQVLHASGPTEAPHSAVFKANMSVWFPLGVTVDPVDRVAEVAFAAQAANNAAAILDRIEQHDIWRRVPASVSQMLLSNQLKPDTASSSSSFPSFSTLSTPVRASRSSQSSNQLPVDDHESASVASVSVWPCASAACLVLTWASALGLSAARRNLGAMFAAGRSGFARVSWVNREPVVEASVDPKSEVPVPEAAVPVEPAVDLNQSFPIPSISVSAADPKPVLIADALVLARAATDASPMLRSETVGASVPKDVVLATHLLAAALSLSNSASDSADIESSLLRLVPPSTVAHFLAAIRDDSIDAQLAIAQMYELGELTAHVNNVVLAASSKLPGVTSCASAAQYWYQRALIPRSNDASIKRQARAACRLAVLLDNQITSSLNAAKTQHSDPRQEAVGLFRWAAAAGDAWAFKFLGSIVQHGRPAGEYFYFTIILMLFHWLIQHLSVQRRSWPMPKKRYYFTFALSR